VRQYSFLLNSLQSSSQGVYSGDLNDSRKIKIRWADTICGIWPMDFILPFQMSVGTVQSLNQYLKNLEVLIYCDKAVNMINKIPASVIKYLMQFFHNKKYEK